ncbi:MAG TPA: ammonia channel protein, partial [Brevundimonas sp.]|nr:ammonia channel protein [Brevundimonas sp.]
MRFATAAAPTAILAALFLTAAPALAQDAAPAPAAAAAAAGEPTDAELARFAAAMKTVQSVAATVQNGTP